MRGLVVVLVIDEEQARADHGSLARVCRTIDVETLDELTDEVQIAAAQAGNQLRLAATVGAHLRALGLAV
jgi:hypothetical protein